MGASGSSHAPGALAPGNRRGTHSTERYVGCRADLDGCGNFAPTAIRSPDLPQPVASRYTEYSIPVQALYTMTLFYLTTFDTHFTSARLTFYSLAVTLRTTRFNIQ
jgi:hypothetical protein